MFETALPDSVLFSVAQMSSQRSTSTVHMTPRIPSLILFT